MSATASRILSATHLVFGGIAADRLAQLGAVNVVCANDCLILGPSRLNVVEHVRVRSAWWGASSEEGDRLYASDVRWEPPVVLWLSASPGDSLNLWRACSWLRDRGLSERDTLIVELEPRPRRPGAVQRYKPFDCNESVDNYPDDVLTERLLRARPLPRARFSRGVDLWRRFVQANPLGFARRCAREVPQLWTLLSSFLPRLTPSGLRLSRFDELLLNVLSTEEWKTPVRVYVHDEAEWRALLCCTGDVWLPGRLDQWTKHGMNPAVERAVGPKPGNPMLSSIYRLTERGMQLRERLPQLADAPRLPVGGAEAYAPESPWVLWGDGRLVANES
jgi:hypothetical protein